MAFTTTSELGHLWIQLNTVHCLNISQLQSVTPAADKKPLVLLNLQWGGSAGTKITARYFTFKCGKRKRNVAAAYAFFYSSDIYYSSDSLYTSDAILFLDVYVFLWFNLKFVNQREKRAGAVKYCKQEKYQLSC